jgi:hypothetical protein
MQTRVALCLVPPYIRADMELRFSLIPSGKCHDNSSKEAKTTFFSIDIIIY